MRRLLSLALGLTLLMSAPQVAEAHHGWRWQECRFARFEGGGGFTINEVQTTISCAVSRWDVPGGVTAAKCIAAHESGYNEENLNVSSGAAGVYQFLRSTWASVVHNQVGIFRRWNLRQSVFNARANIIAAIRIAHMGSWSPWTTGPLCGV